MSYSDPGLDHTTPPFDRAVPRASALLEALRGVGYSPWTSVADLVDNSIAAGARRVQVDFGWQGSASYVTVLDDGCGMEREALISAMRPGSRSPMEIRASHDLGRFGLGLKTASLAQCRVLTVASKRNGAVAVSRWDLDYIARVDDWWLLIGFPEELVDKVKMLDDVESGTLVLWTKIDRMMSSAGSDNMAAKDRFLDIAKHVELHLAMTFHRFLGGSRPKLELIFNGRRVRPWDPFMMAHPATTPTPLEHIPYAEGWVEVEGFILPHKDQLTTSEFELGAGPEGWLAHQGFFVYRNERLLVPGGWLSLGRGKRWARDEVHRLARIRLDIPNAYDGDWKIDIKKSVAIPPAGIRSRLQTLAEKVRKTAREVFAHRGGRGNRNAVAPVRAWTSIETKKGVTYRIDRDHPSVKQVLEALGEHRQKIEEMLRVIEAAVPVQRIWLDTAESGDVAPVQGAQPDPDLLSSLKSLYRHMVRDLGMKSTDARSRLLLIEPFNQFPGAVSSLLTLDEVP